MIRVSVTFLLIGSSSTKPCFLRSSGTNAMPAEIDCEGECLLSSFPKKLIDPLSIGSIPKIALATSVLPAPTRPASDTISPALTCISMLLNFPRLESPETSRTVSPMAASSFGKRALMSRPTISLMISVSEVSLVL